MEKGRREHAIDVASAQAEAAVDYRNGSRDVAALTHVGATGSLQPRMLHPLASRHRRELGNEEVQRMVPHRRRRQPVQLGARPDDRGQGGSGSGAVPLSIAPIPSQSTPVPAAKLQRAASLRDSLRMFLLCSILRIEIRC